MTQRAEFLSCSSTGERFNNAQIEWGKFVGLHYSGNGYKIATCLIGIIKIAKKFKTTWAVMIEEYTVEEYTDPFCPMHSENRATISPRHCFKIYVQLNTEMPKWSTNQVFDVAIPVPWPKSQWKPTWVVSFHKSWPTTLRKNLILW